MLRELPNQLDGFEVPDERLNPNGGAVAIGHPFGSSGTRYVLTLATELQRARGPLRRARRVRRLGPGRRAGPREPVGLMICRDSPCRLDRGAWVDAEIASGVPAEYGEILTVLKDTIASGSGSRPNDDLHPDTGTPPTSFAEFAQRTTSAWAVEVAGCATTSTRSPFSTLSVGRPHARRVN